jgi:hypothetical protein
VTLGKLLGFTDAFSRAETGFGPRFAWTRWEAVRIVLFTDDGPAALNVNSRNSPGPSTERQAA